MIQSFHLVLNGEDARRRAIEHLQRLVIDHEKGLAQVIIKKWAPPKTQAQNKTLWGWHGEVAAHLNAKRQELHSLFFWEPEDVHEYIFLPKCMPFEVIWLPNGEALHKPIRTSDTINNSRPIMSEAMEKYINWCNLMEIDLTIPEDDCR